MMLRRLFVGLTVMSAVSVLSWGRADDTAAPAPAAVPVCSAQASGSGGGNQDEAIHRYRTNQSNHWKHVVIGTH